MNLSYKTAAVIIPPKEVWEPIQKIRQLYDHKINRWMPHITLLYPFIKVDKFQSIENDFVEACQLIKPFKINIKNLNCFAKGKILWLDPHPRENTITLQKSLVEAINYPVDSKRKFTAHMTVGRFKKKSELQETFNNLQKEWQNLEFTVNHISLIAREDPPNDVFEVKTEIALRC